MGRGPHITDVERNNIIDLIRSGKSPEEIETISGKSISTINRIGQAIKKEPVPSANDTSSKIKSLTNSVAPKTEKVNKAPYRIVSVEEAIKLSMSGREVFRCAMFDGGNVADIGGLTLSSLKGIKYDFIYLVKEDK